ncbi:hypothetical protein PUMCH_000974 [Australozyma saopauloensis]|uniref:SWI/SNF complex subunit SWI3 n=1 Tax=Australozyma saopauloensis TaxID=291208 RepID=A0AAX4H5W5_9ASCO|nr:hypothetical protein PUMCH_000974 [[Candida] saopauloensis]
MSDSELMQGLLPEKDASTTNNEDVPSEKQLLYNMDIDSLPDQELNDQDIDMNLELPDVDGDDEFLAPTSPASNKSDDLLGLELDHQLDGNDAVLADDANDALNDPVLDDNIDVDEPLPEIPDHTDLKDLETNDDIFGDVEDSRDSSAPNLPSEKTTPAPEDTEEKKSVKTEAKSTTSEDIEPSQPEDLDNYESSVLHTDSEDSDIEKVHKNDESKTSSKSSDSHGHGNKRRILTSPEPLDVVKSEHNDNPNIEPEAEQEPRIEPARLPKQEIIDNDDKTRVRQTHAIVIPSYASWFNINKIHQIERDSLPEFFKTSHPSKSPKIYANYRNFMVNAYRLNPNEYLTLTACRRTLVGDVSTLMRVHRFLNRWGLINYQVNPLFKPAYALEKLPNGSLVGLPNCGDFNVLLDTPRGLFPFNTYKPSPGNVNVEKLKQLVNADSKNAANGVVSAQSDDIADSEPPQKKQKTETGDWSPKELASLLLGIKEHKHDWFMVAKSVGNNRTPQECILKFLSIPIEDKYNKLEDKDLGILKFAPNFPVLSADNPVISNLIFITNFVDADVVKAACAKATKVMDSKIYEKIEEAFGEKTKDEKKNDGDAAAKSSTESNGKVPDELGDILKDEFAEDERENMDVIRDAATGSLGSVAARSHLFATYEEREMQKITQTIINQQLNKLEVKMNKAKTLEKACEKERRNLEQQQSEVFMDRLALTKSTISVSKKLQKAVEILKSAQDKDKATDAEESAKSISTLLEDINALLSRPISYSLTENQELKPADKTLVEEAATRDLLSEASSKPLSVVAPQSFKVWVP